MCQCFIEIYRGSTAQGRIIKMNLCDYGCNREAKYLFKNGKWCCEKDYRKCLGFRKKNSDLHKGKTHTEEHKRKIGESVKGRKLSKETKNKISEKNKGKIRTKEHKRKNSEVHKNTIEKIKEKYPIFAKEEEMRYNPDDPEEKEIQVHCKYSECKRFKEKGGWFTPTYWQFAQRKDALEHDDGNGERYFYCSLKCKQKCSFNFRLDPNTLTEFRKYYINVYKETYKTLKKFSNKIKNIELRGNEYSYDLDHRYSVYDGFENNVDPKIIAHYKNLECIPSLENRKKNRNSSISLEELLVQVG